MASSKEERHIELDNREWELEKKRERERMRVASIVLERSWMRKKKKIKEGRDRDKDNVCRGEKQEEKKSMDEMKWEKGEII